MFPFDDVIMKSDDMTDSCAGYHSAGTGKFKDNEVNTMAADAPAPCVTRPSVVAVLNM